MSNCVWFSSHSTFSLLTPLLESQPVWPVTHLNITSHIPVHLTGGWKGDSLVCSCTSHCLSGATVNDSERLEQLTQDWVNELSSFRESKNTCIIDFTCLESPVSVLLLKSVLAELNAEYHVYSWLHCDGSKVYGLDFILRPQAVKPATISR